MAQSPAGKSAPSRDELSKKPMITAASMTSDLVDRWPTLGAEERLKLFHALPRDEADDFFLDLSAHDQAELIRAMPTGERRLWLRLLTPDDAADLAQEFEPNQRDDAATLYRRALDVSPGYAPAQQGLSRVASGV